MYLKQEKPEMDYFKEINFGYKGKYLKKIFEILFYVLERQFFAVFTTPQSHSLGVQTSILVFLI